MIRAAALELVAPGSSECQLLGHVSDVAFRGRGYEHAVVLDNGVQLSGIFSKVRGSRHDRVGLSIDPLGAQLFDAADIAEATVDGEDVTLEERNEAQIDLSREFTQLG